MKAIILHSPGSEITTTRATKPKQKFPYPFQLVGQGVSCPAVIIIIVINGLKISWETLMRPPALRCLSNTTAAVLRWLIFRTFPRRGGFWHYLAHFSLLQTPEWERDLKELEEDCIDIAACTSQPTMLVAIRSIINRVKRKTECMRVLIQPTIGQTERPRLAHGLDMASGNNFSRWR